jgi:hypothetical protein
VRSPWREAPRRRATWFALIVGVTILHVLFGVEVAANVIGWDSSSPPGMKRIDVDLVQELAPAAPPEGPLAAPVAPPVAPRVARAHVPKAASAAASAAEAAEAEQVAAAEAAARAASEAEAASAAEAAAAASANAAAVAASSASGPAVAMAASVPASTPASSAWAAASPASGAASSPLPSSTGTFEWPPSTRLTYSVVGNYHAQPQRTGDFDANSDGNLHGSARVEWRRDGAHYQVEVDTEVGIFFTDHSMSDGHIGAEGLMPDRWEETRRLPFVRPQQYALQFGPDIVTLQTGQVVARPERVQDSASQFVQFVYLFTLHPDWLQPGRVIEMPLALPRRVGRWLYDVHEPETLSLPFGQIQAIRLSPRPESVRPNEVAVEMWIAPSLQYLPVRARFTLRDNVVDMALDRRPLQAAPAGTRAASDAAPRRPR